MAKRAPRNYLSNHNILEQLTISKKQGRMSDELAKMISLLCERYASKGNFSGYTYVEDMKSYALLNICKNWALFDETKYNNPFAYYTQYIKNSYIQYLKMEKKQRNIRDALLIDKGLDASFTYQLDYSTMDNNSIDPHVLFNPAEVMFQPSENDTNPADD